MKPLRRLWLSVAAETPSSLATAAPLMPVARRWFAASAASPVITLVPRPRRGSWNAASPLLRSLLTARFSVDRPRPNAASISVRRTPLSASLAARSSIAGRSSSSWKSNGSMFEK